MIFNEYGEIVTIENRYKSIDEYSQQFDEILNEGSLDIVNKGLQSVYKIIRIIMDKISEFIDWLQGLSYQKHVKNILKNKDKISFTPNDIPVDLLKCLSSDGIKQSQYTWTNSFIDACDSVNSNSTVNNIEKILYKGNKGTWFIKNTGGLGLGYNYIDKVIKYATSTKEELKSLRHAYSSMKVLNTKLCNSDEKVSADVIKTLHSYMIQAIKSYKYISIECIKLCVKYIDTADTHRFVSFDTDTFWKAINDKDYRRLKVNTINVIRNDPLMRGPEIRKILNILKEKVPDIFEKEIRMDHEERLEKSKWNRDYFIKLTFWFKENFAESRLAYIKEVGTALYGQG